MNWITSEFLRYAGLGFSVIPVKTKRYSESIPWEKDAKLPLVSWKPFQSAAPTNAQILWWAQHWPGAAVAIVTGSVSNLVVIDDDRSKREAATTPQEQERYAAADAFILAISQISTAVSRTAAGRHFYFRPPLDGDRNPMKTPTNAGFLPGVDTRGEGGYVLAPPSLHPTGISYTWESIPEDGIATLPYWAYETVTKMKGELKIEDRFGTEHVTSSLFPVGPIPEGTRNDTLTSSYGKLLRDRAIHDWETARRALWQLNQTQSKPLPLPPDELGRLMESIEKAERERRGDGEVTALAVTAGSLRKMTHEAPRFAVRDFILEGVTQLFGKPKAGKSYLAMQIACAVALGRPLFPRNVRMYAMANHPGGFETTQGDVLYLALEDSERRLDQRVQQILGTMQEPPDNLTFLTRSMPLFDGGLKRIRDWTYSVPNPRLIVIDPLAAFVGEHQGKGNVFRAEYRMFRPIWELGQETRVPIIIVDHASKSKGRMGSTDPFDSGSGTLGGQAAVDTIMIMEHDDKKPRARISFKGRDIERGFLDIEHDRSLPAWRIALPEPEVEDAPKNGKKGHLSVVAS